jgi:hypothetical protein
MNEAEHEIIINEQFREARTNPSRKQDPFMEQSKTLTQMIMPAGVRNERPSRPGAEIPKTHSMERRRGIPAYRGGARSSSLTLPVLLFILVLLAGVYWMQPGMAHGPLTYRMGAVDRRFSMSREEAADAVRTATAIWSRAAGKEIFREDPKGNIEVRFVYDYRQEAADKLRGISGSISYTRGSYDALRARLEREDADFRQKEALLAADVREFNGRVTALNAEISASSGKVTEEAYKRITAEQEELNGMHEGIRQRQQEQRTTIDNLNNLVVVINGIAASLNLEVVKYNKTGASLGGEFNEGLYERKKGRETVTIYHFTSRDRLVRVLAHEFGHALGLAHNNNPRSLMYRLNQSDSLELAPDDIAALKAELRKQGM